jgi:hypothetical protein
MKRGEVQGMSQRSSHIIVTQWHNHRELHYFGVFSLDCTRRVVYVLCWSNLMMLCVLHKTDTQMDVVFFVELRQLDASPK